MKVVIVILLVAVLAALAGAGLFMLRKGSEPGSKSPAMARALAVRVAQHDKAVPAVVGWTLQCSAFGQFIGPPVAAWWTSHHGGWSQTWVTTASAAAVGLLLALALGRALRR